MPQRQMRLVTHLKTGPTALHVSGWRHPESTLDDILEPGRYEHIARVLEAAKFDGCFLAGLFGLYDLQNGSFDAYVRRGGQISFLDPTVVLPVMAATTRHLGLGATLPTSFHTAYHLARWLGSLDAMSKGRVARTWSRRPPTWKRRTPGWTSCRPGTGATTARTRCWKRASRFGTVGTPTPSCAKGGGRAGGPGQGALRQLPGPLGQVARPAVDLAQPAWAPGHHAGRRGPDGMRAFYDNMKSRLAAHGRAPHECAILPAVATVLGETESIARSGRTTSTA